MVRGPKKHKSIVSGQQHGRNQSPGGGSKSPYILDKLLVPRVQTHGKHHSLADVDEVANALRQKYKEYQRRPQAAFRQMVGKAIQVAQAQSQPGANGQSALQESGLDSSMDHAGDSMQDHTGSSRSSSSSSTSGSRDSGSGSGSSSSESSSDEGEQQDPPRDRGGMNNMLLSMYARNPAQDNEDDKAGPGPSSAREATITAPNRKRGRSPPRAAFAPPEAVAAAAARALAGKRSRLDQQATVAELPAAAAAAASSQGTPQPGPQQPDGKTPTMSTGGDGAGTAAGVPVTEMQPPAQPAGTGQLPSAATTPAPNAVPAQPAAPATAPATAKRARKSMGTAGAAGGARPRPYSSGGGGGSAVVQARAVTYADLGGVEDVLADIRELIEYPLKHPEVYAWLGVEPPRGVLLHGPPGCGKTALANAIANECGVPFLRVSAPEIVSGMSGESEAKLRGLFQEAAELAPCIVFIDEIDAIAPKRETAQREMERRIVAQMLTSMDDLSSPLPGPEQPDAPAPPSTSDAAAPAPAPAPPRPHVVVIGATNRPDALDPALRRAGRFDREISLGIPTEAARCKILQVITRKLRLEGNFDFGLVAKKTPGFVGADLMALVKEAAALAVTRIFDTLMQKQDRQLQLQLEQQETAGDKQLSVQETDAAQAGALVPVQAGAQQLGRLGRFGTGPLGPAELAGLAISMGDFEVAVSKVQPSVRREGFTTTPDVTWEDVGSLDEVREELSFSITQPILHPDRFEALGMAMATGVLLYGPPGCGKTLVAKAVANESGANFISIKGPELLNKYVGESERAVRQLFMRARAAQPCVLFFDELDALAPRRGTDTNQAAERVVNQLLTEMDGVDSRNGVFVVAATNRPDMIDPALLRPGRLGKVLFVPLPPPDGRVSILRALVRRTPLAHDVDIALIAHSEQCAGFSGADLAALVREASVLALKDAMRAEHSAAGGAPAGAAGTGAPPAVQVHARHFDDALSRMTPSVSKRDARGYEALRKSLRGNLRSRLETSAAQEDAGRQDSAAAVEGVRVPGPAAVTDPVQGPDGALPDGTGDGMVTA